MKRELLKHALLALCIMVIAVFFAACAKIEFEVNFIVDGELYYTINTNGEEVIKMPTDPQKEGADFDGWFWDKDSWQKPFTANSLLDAPLSSNMSVYAKWVTAESVTGTDAKFDLFESMGGGY